MVVGPLVGEEVRQLIPSLRTPSLAARSSSGVAGSSILVIGMPFQGG